MLSSTVLALGAYSALLAFALTACALPLFAVLQQEGYDGAALLRGFYRKRTITLQRYGLLSLAMALSSALFGLCFSFGGGEASRLAAVLACAGMCTLFCFAFRRAVKVPARATNRMIRLTVVSYLLLFAALFGAMYGLTFAAVSIGHILASALLFAPLGLFPVLLPVLLFAANAVCLIYEIPRRKSLIRRAFQTLSASGCIKVGITGSFAKTSVKHIAATMLSSKYRVIATPASYNTPIGIAKCVNEGGADCDVFLAEMGARRRGDIEELCDMVRPTYGVVTGVCPQHIETFGSLEAVRAEKNVLAQRAEHVVLGVTAADMREDALREGKNFAAENVVLSPEGTEFDLSLGGESVHIKTVLLGRHAAEDIALAAALCRQIGMTMSEIAASVSAIKPVPHRLELLRGRLFVLDDSYNANVEGAKNAVEVLKLFAGRKAVVTPGIVELGELEEEKNKELGASFVGLDLVVLVGETLVRAVREGYLSAGGEKEAVCIVPTLQAAQTLLGERLGEGDAALFLNDLPDKYL